MVRELRGKSTSAWNKLDVKARRAILRTFRLPRSYVALAPPKQLLTESVIGVHQIRGGGARTCLKVVPPSRFRSGLIERPAVMICDRP